MEEEPDMFLDFFSAMDVDVTDWGSIIPFQALNFSIPVVLVLRVLNMFLILPSLMTFLFIYQHLKTNAAVFPSEQRKLPSP